MFLHYINNNRFNIERGDTLKHPANWDDEPFNAIVSNPTEVPTKVGTFFVLPCVYNGLQAFYTLQLYHKNYKITTKQLLRNHLN